MDKLFLTILNMSLTGAFVIATICLARLPLKKAPKIISYCLWAVAGFRLVFPFSIESVFGLIPFKAQTIPPDIAVQSIPRIDSGIPFVNNAVSSVLPAATPTAGVNPLQIWITAGAFVWLTGVAVMLIYGVVSFVILKRKMREAAHIDANIYEAGNITSPFVLGVFKPRIYLPIGLSGQERSYILLHEQTHIRRRDHIVKFAAYFILCLHWFNPLAWAAFLLMGVDMELSCDERVLREMGGEIKRDYSLSLLSLATERRVIGGSPLAFGEGGIKERVKNILNFKKTSRVIIVAAVVLVAVLSVGFAVDRVSYAINMEDWEIYDFPDKNFEQVFFECNDTPYNPEYIVISAQLMNNQNIQGLICSSYFTLVKQAGDTWNIVPFADGTGFKTVAHQLENGSSFDYSIRPEMFTDELSEGQYRIVTDIYHHRIEGEVPEKHTVWADFIIDKNAPKQETYEFAIPSEAPIKTYSLENPTERQKLERLSFVNLYGDGTAWLAAPPISSYMLPNCTYDFADGELLIYANIKTEELENAFGIKNGEVIARFTVADDNTLVFGSAAVPLFADVGARYVSPLSTVPKIETKETMPPEKAPRLEISFMEDGLSEQQIQAAQLTTGWHVTGENGEIYGYESDSLHAMQLHDYDDIMLQLYKTGGEIVFRFTDDYLPQSISVQRWNAKYTGDDLTGIWDNGEPIELLENGFSINDDGHDYIYEVYAKWEQGSSWYSFRVDAVGKQPDTQ